MNKRFLPIGIQDFEDVRTRGCIYVDKTELIYKLATEGKPYFLSRPRRFGKSLLLSTMEAYFLGKKELFKGLALETLEKESYVDDLRFSQAFVRDKSSLQGWGPAKIRYMLAAKGVASEVIDAAIPSIDRDKADLKLQKLLENKYRSLKDDPQCRLKLLRFGLGRGYSYDQVSVQTEELLKNN